MLTVTLKITDKCNLDCEKCGKYNNCFGKSEIPTSIDADSAKDILRTFKKFGYLSLNVVGGEPLLHPAVYEIIGLASYLGYYTQLFTNGLIITEDAVAELEENAALSVSIGVDYIDMEKYSPTSNSELLSRISTGIRSLKKADIPVGLNITINSTNFEKIDYFMHFAKKLGVNFVRILPSIDSDFLLYYKTLQKIKEIIVNDSCNLLLDFVPVTQKVINKINFNCFSMSAVYITPDLKMTSCPYTEIFSDISDGTTPDLFFKLRDQINGVRKKHPPTECKRCASLKECPGSCYAIGSQEHAFCVSELIRSLDLCDDEMRKALSTWLYKFSLSSFYPRCFRDAPLWTLDLIEES